MSNKHKKLVHGASLVKVGKELLQKNIKRTLSQGSTKRWESPFSGISQKNKYKGQPLIPKKI
jgi:hypothetical protein